MKSFREYISEDTDLGKKIVKATKKDNDSYKILDNHPKTEGSTWAAGGCGILAHALHKHLSGSRIVDIHNHRTGNTEHVAVQHGEHIYDSDGKHPVKNFINKYKKLENIKDDLEMRPHDPDKTKKSGIVIDKGLIDKTYEHLKGKL